MGQIGQYKFRCEYKIASSQSQKSDRILCGRCRTSAKMRASTAWSLEWGDMLERERISAYCSIERYSTSCRNSRALFSRPQFSRPLFNRPRRDKAWKKADLLTNHIPQRRGRMFWVFGTQKNTSSLVVLLVCLGENRPSDRSSVGPSSGTWKKIIKHILQSLFR